MLLRTKTEIFTKSIKTVWFVLYVLNLPYFPSSRASFTRFSHVEIKQVNIYAAVLKVIKGTDANKFSH